MLLIHLFESKVTYKTLPTTKFKVLGVKSFEELKQHPDLLRRTGNYTTIIDVSNEERVAKASGENKWNAMRAIYGHDEDEIVCAKAFHNEWVCMAINVMV